MTTYWVVIAIVMGAAALVLLAFWYQIAPGGPGRNRRWVAMGTSFTPMPGVRSWVAGIDVGGGAEGIDLTVAGATLSDVVAGQLGPALAARPSAVVLWVGANDLLFGTPLPGFLRDLMTVIGRLQRQGSQILLVGLPDLATDGPAIGRRGNPLAETTEAWRKALREMAELTGSTLILVPASSDAGPERRTVQITGAVPWLDPTTHTIVADIVSPVLRQALRDGRYPAGPSERWDEPADPVQRRRLGLPPVR